jgi:hypothetical protein
MDGWIGMSYKEGIVEVVVSNDDCGSSRMIMMSLSGCRGQCECDNRPETHSPSDVMSLTRASSERKILYCLNLINVHRGGEYELSVDAGV